MYFEGYEMAITLFGLLVILVGWISYKRGYRVGYRDGFTCKEKVRDLKDV